MAVLSFPDIVPDSEEWTLEYSSRSFASELNGRRQTVELPGHRWSVSLSFNNRQGRDARALSAFLTELEGMAGRFYVTPSDATPLGTATENGTLDAPALSGATSVQASGFMPSGQLILAAGDYVEINGELKEVTADVYGAEVEFAPPLRVSQTAGAEVKAFEPRAVMMLDTDDQAGWAINAPIIYSLNIEAREPLDI